MSEQTVNGINVSKLKETIQAIKGKPSLADFKFRIVNKWQGGGLNETTVKASHGAGQEFPDRDGKFTMQADEPPILLSGDKAANPVEHLLHAVAACVTTTAVYHAAARHIPLEAVESTLEGELDLRGFLDLDPNVPKGYKNIRMNMHVTGNLSEEQKQEVVQLGCKFSPVYNMVSKSVPITVELAS
ncbi:MAG TPA: OsmC family protein [Candidatus Binatia bacterium]|nr:OsmC family protein [Candidatus Binatia bacterium]